MQTSYETPQVVASRQVEGELSAERTGAWQRGAWAASQARPGRYVVGESLGCGGYGSVYAAWDTQIQRSVALKRMSLRGDFENWLREARLGARLSHRAFAAVHDVFVDQQYGCIVMERIHGRPLSAVMAEGPVAPSLAIDWMIQAAEALSSANAMQIVHGDIKPANIMIDAGNGVRILDLGVARTLDNMATRAHGGGLPSIGTLVYMAPEQLMGTLANVSTDIYGLGLVFCEMLTGRKPFTGCDGLTLAYRKLDATPEDIGLVSLPRFPHVALARQMVETNPAKRPASMNEVLRRLRSSVRQWQG